MAPENCLRFTDKRWLIRASFNSARLIFPPDRVEFGGSMFAVMRYADNCADGEIDHSSPRQVISRLIASTSGSVQPTNCYESVLSPHNKSWSCLRFPKEVRVACKNILWTILWDQKHSHWLVAPKTAQQNNDLICTINSLNLGSLIFNDRPMGKISRFKDFLAAGYWLCSLWDFGEDMQTGAVKLPITRSESERLQRLDFEERKKCLMKIYPRERFYKDRQLFLNLLYQNLLSPLEPDWDRWQGWLCVASTIAAFPVLKARIQYPQNLCVLK